MLRFTRRLAFPLSLLVLAGCGNDIAAAGFPLVRGVYDYHAAIDELPGSGFVGTMAVRQSRTADFDGTYELDMISPEGWAVGTAKGNITRGKVTKEGKVTFDFGGPDWRMSGSISGNTISGTWLSTGDSDYRFTGSFTALRR